MALDMEALAESSIDQRPRSWVARGATVASIALVIILLIAAALWLRQLLGGPETVKRQVSKISILPDTPPPPPPPKQEKAPEPPKQEAKSQAQPEQPKQPAPTPIAEAPIKMEGEAGDGPSAFAAGSVAQEYKGGAPAVGASGTGGGSGLDRANERLYANTARQLLRDELQRQLSPDAGELMATLAIWIEPDGRIRRFELQASDRPERDAQMQLAMTSVTRMLQLPPPPVVAQPMRFRVTLRPQG